jgi:ABC-type glycerol-3-phosphate transport system permease component
MRGRTHTDIWRILGLSLFCAIWVAPILFILRVAVLDSAAASSGILGSLTLRHYATVFQNREFLTAMVNSLLIGIASTLLIIAIAIPAAFICGTREFPGRAQIESWILSTRMMPAFVVVLPYFLLYRDINLLDTLTGLIVMHIVVSLALAFFMLRSFFAELPREIIEAAYVEGAGVYRTMVSVALPQVRSGIMATAILVFIFSWNELAFAFTLAGGAVKTGPVAILAFMGFQNVQIGPLMAAASLLILPIALLLIATQRAWCAA